MKKLLTIALIICTGISAQQTDRFSTRVSGTVLHEDGYNVSAQTDFCSINPKSHNNYTIDPTNGSNTTINGKLYKITTDRKVIFTCSGTTNMEIQLDIPDDGLIDPDNGIEIVAKGICTQCKTGNITVTRTPFNVSNAMSFPYTGGSKGITTYVYARHTSGDYNQLPESFSATYTWLFIAT